MTLFDNKLVQIGLVFLFFYVMLQIVNKNQVQENLDTLVSDDQLTQLPSYPTSVSVSPNPPDSVIQLQTTPLITPDLPVATETPSAALTGEKIPAALTSVDETLVAAAPKGAITTTTENIFAPEPTDFETLFEKRTSLEPSDLIPKNNEAELYGGLTPDPKLDQNFLQNRWSLGIDASIGKHNYVNDLRGGHTNPITNTGIFNLPTKFPDLYRKSLQEVS